jgi:hypothetical protein
MRELNQGREAGRADHVLKMHELAREMRSAISALERNDLPEFQRHLANQEVISAELDAGLRAVISRCGDSQGTGPRFSVEKDFYHAAGQLAQVNRIFAAVLRRSVRSAALLGALYQSSAGAYGNTSAVAERRTISCEV